MLHFPPLTIHRERSTGRPDRSDLAPVDRSPSSVEKHSGRPTKSTPVSQLREKPHMWVDMTTPHVATKGSSQRYVCVWSPPFCVERHRSEPAGAGSGSSIGVHRFAFHRVTQLSHRTPPPLLPPRDQGSGGARVFLDGAFSTSNPLEVQVHLEPSTQHN